MFKPFFKNILNYFIIGLNILFIIAIIIGIYFWKVNDNYRKMLKFSTGQYDEVSFLKDENKKSELPSINNYVSLLIIDLGLNENSRQNAMILPAEVAFGFSPYDDNLIKNITEAKNEGHEIYINLPLEPENFPLNSNGNYSLLTNNSITQNIANLNILRNISNNLANGFYISGPEKFSQEAAQFRTILQEMKNMNINLVNTYTPKNAQLIDEYNLGLIKNIIYLDEEIEEEKIKDKLNSIIDVVKNNKFTLIVTKPYPLILSKINEWLFQNNGNIKIVNISNLLGQMQKDKISNE